MADRGFRFHAPVEIQMSEGGRGYTELYRTAIESVVSVHDTARTGRGSQGSGFVYDADGHVVTNHHVVGDADRLEVRFSEGDWATADVAGTDFYTDLAVLGVDSLPAYVDPLPVAGENPEPGQPVAALGNPLGLHGTITVGVVSGVNRSMVTSGGFAIPDTVQTDAAINPGNSGGPLVTPEGTVVGVNRAKQGENIGFAISPDIVNRVVPALIDEGTYPHSYLQVRTVDVSPVVARANGLEEPRGILVIDVGDGPCNGVLRGCTDVVADGNARIPVGGDVIVGLEGREIRSHEELVSYLIRETEPGQPVGMTVVRDGETVQLDVTLGTRPRPRRIGVT